MTQKTFKIRKRGNKFVAFDSLDKSISYGSINIKTGKCVGGTLCFDALREHLASTIKVVKKTYTVWMMIEEHTEYTDGNEEYIDLKDEETRSCGRFNTLDEAFEQMNNVAEQHEGDFTK